MKYAVFVVLILAVILFFRLLQPSLPISTIPETPIPETTKAEPLKLTETVKPTTTPEPRPALAIQSLKVEPVTDSNAVISWVTSLPATTQVDYGFTATYGSTSDQNAELTTSHSITLTGLKPETTYYFRISSAAKDRTLAITGNTGQFSTKALPEKLFKIAFASNRDGNYEIHTMNSDGTNQTRLTYNLSHDCSMPAWSPDGKRIAFHSLGDGKGEIYVMNADGSNQTRITNNLSALYPVWSPDGKKIAFSSNPTGNADIYVMNADGSNQTRLTNNISVQGPSAWSSDGNKIAFNGNNGIYVMNVDGSNQTRLTNNTNDYHPSWSPDSKKIAFFSDRDGNMEIYVMNADGSNQTRLTNNISYDWNPDWSPDGKKIAFNSNRDGNNEIYIMNADGSNQIRLTNNLGSDIDPAWSP